MMFLNPSPGLPLCFYHIRALWLIFVIGSWLREADKLNYAYEQPVIEIIKK